MSAPARHDFGHRASSDSSSARPGPDESGEPIRILPIAGLAGFIALTVVLARVSSRLADITGVVLLAAALAWLLWPAAARLRRRLGMTGMLVVIVVGCLSTGVGVGGLLLGDLTVGADALADRVNSSLSGQGDRSILSRTLGAVRLGDGVGGWLQSLPNSVLFDNPDGPAVGRRVADFLVVVVLTAFLLASGPQLVAAMVAWWPRPERAQVWALLADIEDRAGGYLRRLTIVGIATSTVMAGVAAIAGAPMPVALGLWVGFWLTVPLIGWVVGLAPVVLVCSYLDPLPASVLATVALVATVVVHLIRRRDRATVRTGPGCGTVVSCLAVGVAISGSSTAMLMLIIGVVVHTALASEYHGALRLPTPPAGDRSTYRVGPVVLPGGVLGVVLAATTVVVSVISWTVAVRAADALVWIVVAALLAIALERPVQFVSRRLHVPRTASLALVFTVIAAIVCGLAATALVEGPTSAARALERLPGVLAELEEAPVVGSFLENRQVADTIARDLEQLPSRLSRSRGALAWFPSVGSQLVGALWVLTLTVALSVDGRRMVDGLTNRVSARHRRQVVRFTAVAQTALAGYAAGAVLVSAMNATVVLLLALILQIGLAPVLALWAFLWDFVPQVGGIIGGIPLLLLSLVAGPSAFVIATAVYLVYQIIESNIVFPRIIGDSVDIAAWATMVAALAGAAAGGVVGAIVVTPLVGVVRLAILEYRRGDFPGRTAAPASGETALPTRF